MSVTANLHAVGGRHEHWFGVGAGKGRDPDSELCFSRFPSVLWTAQGQFLVANSEASTINRNTGVFWALLQCRYSCDQYTGHMTPPEAERNMCLCVFSLAATRDHLFIKPSSCSKMIHLLRL